MTHLKNHDHAGKAGILCCRLEIRGAGGNEVKVYLDVVPLLCSMCNKHKLAHLHTFVGLNNVLIETQTVFKEEPIKYIRL